jgi:hypothetical protein
VGADLAASGFGASPDCTGFANAGAEGNSLFGAAAATGAAAGGRTDSDKLKTGVSFVPSTRMPAWHCLHLMVTTRPLTLRS